MPSRSVSRPSLLVSPVRNPQNAPKPLAFGIGFGTYTRMFDDENHEDELVHEEVDFETLDEDEKW